MILKHKETGKEVVRCWILVDVENTWTKRNVEDILKLWTPCRCEKYELVAEYKEGFRQYVVNAKNRHMWRLLDELHRELLLDVVDFYYAVIPVKKSE